MPTCGTGRGPVTTGLNAEGVGLEMDRGYIKVDAQYRTSVPGISAVGDVITLGTPGHPQLAHVSSAEGIIAAERIAGQDTRPINYDHVPGCTYCDPEIGSVGLTEREAKDTRATTCASARFRSASSAARRWPARPKAS